MEVREEVVSCEWDDGWFCEECWSLQHWKKKALVINGKKYCRSCGKDFLKKEGIEYDLH